MFTSGSTLKAFAALSWQSALQSSELHSFKPNFLNEHSENCENPMFLSDFCCSLRLDVDDEAGDRAVSSDGQSHLLNFIHNFFTCRLEIC